MECSLCKKSKGLEVEKGGICTLCGRFFCSNCIIFKEIDGLIQGFCKFCETPERKRVPVVLFLYPAISYFFFFIFYFSIKDYVGKNLLIFFTLPFISFLPFYFDFHFRKPLNPPLLLYFFLYFISLLPWLYSTINLLRLY